MNDWPNNAAAEVDRVMTQSLAVACAAVALLIGVLFYLFVRPEAAAFVPAALHHPQAVGAAVTMLGQWLPTFCHTAGFSLATALIAGLSTRAIIGAATFWGAANLLFEFGQHASVRVALPDFSAVNRRLAGTEFAERFFTQGCFDYADLAAAVAGAGVAVLIGCLLLRRRRQAIG